MSADGSPPVVPQLSASGPREQLRRDSTGDIIVQHGIEDWTLTGTAGTNYVGAGRYERPGASEQLASDPRPSSPPQAKRPVQAAASTAAATKATAAEANAVAADAADARIVRAPRPKAPEANGCNRWQRLVANIIGRRQWSDRGTLFKAAKRGEPKKFGQHPTGFGSHIGRWGWREIRAFW